jgi:HPt (histidine-containing phosphotransfer) domain-containing protein
VSPLIERLRSVDGFEVDALLHNVAGSPTALERVLRKFVGAHAAGLPALIEAPAAELPAHALAACHSLRGVMATVGAVALMQRVVALEDAVQRQADLATLRVGARGLHEALLVLVGQLVSALADSR